MKKILILLLACRPLFALDVEINPQKRFQEIEYFAASDAWSTQYIGDYWEDKFKEKIARLLFSQKFDRYGNPEGIGLSLWRVNLGGGSLEGDTAHTSLPWRGARTFLPPDSDAYDWSRCKGLNYFMEKAREYGCGQFLLFSNSPPVRWTKNGKGYASKMETNIAPENIGKFADYLADCAGHFCKEGFDVKYISPINEPQMNWTRDTQEGSPWANSDIKRMFSELDRALSERNLGGVKMLAGECISLEVAFEGFGEWTRRNWESTGLDESEDPQYFLKSFFAPDGKYYIGNLKHIAPQIAAHSYHSHKKNGYMKSVREKMRAEAEKYGLDFHQSEWCHLGFISDYRKLDGFNSDYLPDSMNDMQTALNMAKLIYADIVVGNSKSWSYWVATEIKYGLCALIHVAPHTDSPKRGGTIAPTKLLWALGNYSFFIRPGYCRISLEGADDFDRVVASAYISPDGKKIAAVFVNMGESAEPLKMAVSDGYSPSAVYVTDERRDLAKIVGQSEKIGGAQIFLMPRSVTSVLLERK